MNRLTDKRFLGEGFYCPKNKEEMKEIQMMRKHGYDEIYKKLGEYEDLEERGLLLRIHYDDEVEKEYTLERIIDAIVQCDIQIVEAIKQQDRVMLEDALKSYLD